MASVFVGDVVATVWEELSVHALERSEVFFQLHILIGLTACDDTDHVRHDLV